MPRGRSAKKPSSALILDVSETILTTLQDAANVSTIPFFHEAAGLALGILKVIQGTKENKDGFKYLAGDVCTLVYTIIRASEEQKGLSIKDLDNVKELLGTLASIERFARREASQQLILRVIRHKSDVGKIQRYREQMRHALTLFEFKASISIQESLASIAQRQDEFLLALQQRLDHAKQEVRSSSQIGHEGQRQQEDKGNERLKIESAGKRRELEQDGLPHQQARSEERKERRTSDGQERARITEGELHEQARVTTKRETDCAPSEELRPQLERPLTEAVKWAEERNPTREHGNEVRTPGQANQDGHYSEEVDLSHTQPFPASKNPFRQYMSPAFSITHVSGGSFTSIGGNYVKTDSSQYITNTNSGNTTTTTISNSNNDSYRTYSAHPRRRGRSHDR